MSGHITPEENEHHPETRLERQAEQASDTIRRLTTERDEAVKRIDFMGGSSRRRAHDEPCKFCGEPINSWGGNPELWPVFMCWRDDPGKMKPHHVGCIRKRIVAAESAEVALEQVEQKYDLAIRTIASAELENLDSKATIARLTAERDEAVKKLVAQQRTFPIQNERGAAPHPLRIPWPIAELAYSDYSARYGRGQSLERLAERGGFGPSEMDIHLPGWRDMCSAMKAMESRAVAAEKQVFALCKDRADDDTAIRTALVAFDDSDSNETITIVELAQRARKRVAVLANTLEQIELLIDDWRATKSEQVDSLPASNVLARIGNFIDNGSHPYQSRHRRQRGRRDDVNEKDETYRSKSQSVVKSLEDFITNYRVASNALGSDGPCILDHERLEDIAEMARLATKQYYGAPNAK